MADEPGGGEDDKPKPPVDGVKWIAGAVAVAAPLLAIGGLSGGEIARLVRIHPEYAFVGAALIGLSTVLGVIGLLEPHRARKAGLAGLAAFMSGILVLLYFHARAVGTQERPTATLGVKKTETGYSALVTVRAGGMRPNQYVFVLLEGHNSQRALQPNSAAFTGPVQPLQGRFYKQRLYKGRVGPNPAGTVDVSFEVAVAEDLYELVVVQTVIAEHGDDKNETALVEGVHVKDTPQTKFACDSTSTNVSCASVLLPAAPRATG